MKASKCYKCGHVTKKGEKFCGNCGAELTQNKETKKQEPSNIKKDFIQEFFERNSTTRISKIAKFLFCDKNRISGSQAFAGYIKLWFLCGLFLLPLWGIASCLGNSIGGGGTFFSIITYIWFGIIAIFFLAMYIKQNISRLHDLGCSGWWTILTINPTFFLILLFIPGNKDKNEYGEPNITQQQGLTEEERKEQNKKLSLIWKVPVIIIGLIVFLLFLIILTNM